MVRRCVDALGGTARSRSSPRAPRTSSPRTSASRRDIGRRSPSGCTATAAGLDVGRFNGERFAVMAGAGFDAAMISGADDLKDRLGRAAYLWSGSRNLRGDGFEAKIKVDGDDWYEGPASCILLGNVGDLFGGIEVFPDAQPDDGLLDLGVVTADGLVAVVRTLAARRSATRTGRRSSARPRRARWRSSSTARSATSSTAATAGRSRSFKVDVEAGAITVCVPRRRGRQDARTMETTMSNSASRARPHRPGRGRGVSPTAATFDWLARAGLVARGVIYAIIGVLAIKLALGDGGKATNQQGALKTIANQPFGKALLDPRRDRPGRLRALAARARRHRPRPRAQRRHEGPARGARQRDRLRRCSA